MAQLTAGAPVPEKQQRIRALGALALTFDALSAPLAIFAAGPLYGPRPCHGHHTSQFDARA